jgi:hypothetical protein
MIANRNAMLLPLIEDASAIAEIEAIAALPRHLRAVRRAVRPVRLGRRARR